ncbi:MAG TPA: hypothetical protein VIH18_30915 [Candidatus Binatia bacterium]|jgi:hypothetical protein
MPIVKYRRRHRSANISAPLAFDKEVNMKSGDSLKTTKPIRSQKTGVMLPREGTFVRAVENMGRQLILVNFGTAGEEYLFPDEILAEQAMS